MVAESPVVLDQRTRRCFVRTSEIPVTQLEWHVLERLNRDPGRAYTVRDLLEGTDYSIDSIRLAMSRLRAKGGRDLITVIRGYGYRLNVD